jgi:hypothetical protein
VRNRAAAAKLAPKVEGGMQVVYPPIAGSENFSPQSDAGVAPTWGEPQWEDDIYDGGSDSGQAVRNGVWQ